MVVLLTIAEPLPTGAAPAVDYEIVLKASAKAAEEYPSTTKARLTKERLNVETRVSTERPAKSITAFVWRQRVDFVALGTRAHSEVSRWVFGSLADSLVRLLSVPVLLITPEGFASGI